MCHMHITQLVSGFATRIAQPIGAAQARRGLECIAYQSRVSCLLFYTDYANNSCGLLIELSALMWAGSRRTRAGERLYLQFALRQSQRWQVVQSSKEGLKHWEFHRSKMRTLVGIIIAARTLHMIEWHKRHLSP